MPVFTEEDRRRWRALGLELPPDEKRPAARRETAAQQYARRHGLDLSAPIESPDDSGILANARRVIFRDRQVPLTPAAAVVPKTPSRVPEQPRTDFGGGRAGEPSGAGATFPPMGLLDQARDVLRYIGGSVLESSAPMGIGVGMNPPRELGAVMPDLGKAVLKSGLGALEVGGRVMRFAPPQPEVLIPGLGPVPLLPQGVLRPGVRAVGGAIVGLMERAAKALPYSPAAEREPLRSIVGGVESLGPSVAAGLPGTVAGGGPVGYAVSGGVLMGLAEYDRAYQQAIENGVPEQSARKYAWKSASAEAKGEFLSDLFEGGLLLGRFGKGARAGVRAWMKGVAKALPAEVGSEYWTAETQASAAREVGLPALPPGESGKQALGPAAVMTLLMGGATFPWNGSPTDAARAAKARVEAAKAAAPDELPPTLRAPAAAATTPAGAPTGPATPPNAPIPTTTPAPAIHPLITAVADQIESAPDGFDLDAFRQNVGDNTFRQGMEEVERRRRAAAPPEPTPSGVPTPSDEAAPAKTPGQKMYEFLAGLEAAASEPTAPAVAVPPAETATPTATPVNTGEAIAKRQLGLPLSEAEQEALAAYDASVPPSDIRPATTPAAPAGAVAPEPIGKMKARERARRVAAREYPIGAEVSWIAINGSEGRGVLAGRSGDTLQVRILDEDGNPHLMPIDSASVTLAQAPVPTAPEIARTAPPPTQAPPATAGRNVPGRWSWGKTAKPEEKAEILRTLRDVYKVKGAPVIIKRAENGEPLGRGYAYRPDLFVISALTGRPLRYYVTLPDGRIAHPSELWPELTDEAIEELERTGALLVPLEGVAPRYKVVESTDEDRAYLGRGMIWEIFEKPEREGGSWLSIGSAKTLKGALSFPTLPSDLGKGDIEIVHAPRDDWKHIRDYLEVPERPVETTRQYDPVAQKDVEISGVPFHIRGEKFLLRDDAAGTIVHAETGLTVPPSNERATSRILRLYRTWERVQTAIARARELPRERVQEAWLGIDPFGPESQHYTPTWWHRVETPPAGAPPTEGSPLITAVADQIESAPEGFDLDAFRQSVGDNTFRQGMEEVERRRRAAPEPVTTDVPTGAPAPAPATSVNTGEAIANRQLGLPLSAEEQEALRAYDADVPPSDTRPAASPAAPEIARTATPPTQAPPVPETPVQGQSQALETGEVPVQAEAREGVRATLETVTGRRIVLPPGIRTTSSSAANSDIRKRSRWLRDQGIEEARSRKDEWNEQLFTNMNPDRLTAAEGDVLHDYLFGQTDGIRVATSELAPGTRVTWESEGKARSGEVVKRFKNGNYQVRTGGKLVNLKPERLRADESQPEVPAATAAPAVTQAPPSKKGRNEVVPAETPLLMPEEFAAANETALPEQDYANLYDAYERMAKPENYSFGQFARDLREWDKAGQPGNMGTVGVATASRENSEPYYRIVGEEHDLPLGLRRKKTAAPAAGQETPKGAPVAGAETLSSSDRAWTHAIAVNNGLNEDEVVRQLLYAREAIRNAPSFAELKQRADATTKRIMLRGERADEIIAEETAAPEKYLTAHAGVMNRKSQAAKTLSRLADQVFAETGLPREPVGKFRGDDSLDLAKVVVPPTAAPESPSGQTPAPGAAAAAVAAPMGGGGRQTFRMTADTTVTNTRGKEVTLPAGEEYTAYPVMDKDGKATGKVRLQDGKQVTVYEGELAALQGQLLPPGEAPMAGGMYHEGMSDEEEAYALDAYRAKKFSLKTPGLPEEVRQVVEGRLREHPEEAQEGDREAVPTAGPSPAPPTRETPAPPRRATVTEQPAGSTGTRNAWIRQQLERLGIEWPETEPLPNADVVEDVLRSGDMEKAELFAQKALDGKPLSLREEAAVSMRIRQMQTEENRWHARTREAQEKGDFEEAKGTAEKAVRLAQDQIPLLQGLRAAGTEAARVMQFRRVNFYEDFSLAPIVERLQTAKGAKLDFDEMERVKDLVAQAEASARQAEAMGKERDAALARAAEAEAKLAAELAQKTASPQQTIRKIRRESATSPRAQKRAQVSREIQKEWEDIGARFERAAASRTRATLDPTGLSDPEIRSILVDAIRNRAKAGMNEIGKIADAVHELVSKHFPGIDKEEIVSLTREVRSENLKGLFEKETKDPDPDVARPLGQALRELVLQGETDPDRITDELHKLAKEYFPNITRREVAELVSNYGITYHPDPTHPAAQIREVRRLMRLMLAIEDAEQGKMPAHSGPQPETPSQAALALRQKLSAVLKARNLTFQSTLEERAARQLTRAEARLAFLAQRLVDLRSGLDVGKTAAAPLPPDPAVEAVRKKIEAVQAQIDAIKPKDIDTPRQAALRKDIEDLDRRIATRDMDRPQRPTPVYNEETRRLQALRDSKRKELLRQNPVQGPKDINTPRQKQLQRQMSALQAQLQAKQRLHVQREEKQYNADTLMMQDAYNAILKEVRGLPDPETKRQKLTRALEAIEKRIRDFGKEEPEKKADDTPDTPEESALRTRIEQRRQEYADLKARDIDTPRQRQLRREIARLNQQLVDGVAARKGKARREYNVETNKLRAQRDDLRRQLNALIPPKSPVDAARERRASSLRRLADLFQDPDRVPTSLKVRQLLHAIGKETLNIAAHTAGNDGVDLKSATEEMKKLVAATPLGQLTDVQIHAAMLHSGRIAPDLAKLEIGELRAKVERDRARRELLRMEQALEPKSAWQKLWGNVQVLNSESRELMTGPDVSFMGRQGFVMAAMHLRDFSRAVLKSFAAMKSEEQARKLYYDLIEDPYHPYRQLAGLAVTDPHGPISQREEFRAGQLIERLSRFAGTRAFLAPHRKSSRAYSTFLNYFRAFLFDGMRRPGDTRAQLKEKARLINVFTGRGDLGKYDNLVGLFGQVQFAARYGISKFQAPKFLVSGNPQVRKEAWKSYSASVLLGWLMAYGMVGLARLLGEDDSEVITDLRSADAGKARIGHTRFDYQGFNHTAVVLITRLLTRETRSVKEQGARVRPTTPGSLLELYGRGTLSPVASMAADFYYGKTFKREERRWKNPGDWGWAIADRLRPMGISDVVEAWKSEGPAVGALAGAHSLGGFGVTTIDPKRPRR